MDEVKEKYIRYSIIPLIWYQGLESRSADMVTPADRRISHRPLTELHRNGMRWMQVAGRNQP